MSDIPLPPVASPAHPPLPATRPSYLRTQSAPFVFGLAVGGIWFWQRYLVAVALDPETHSFTGLSARRVVALALGVVATFFVWPAAAAVWSTIGDARFWGVGASARGRACLRLVLALVLAFALGSAWLIQAFAQYGGIANNMVFALVDYLAPFPVTTFAPMVAGFAFLIGLLAAFIFARWPLPAARYALLTQVARWIVVGVLAAAGALLMDSALDLASYATGIAALGIRTTFAYNLAMLTRILGPVAPAAAGGLLGGLLRAGLVRPAPIAPIASAPIAPAPMAARRGSAVWLRGAGAVGMGLLLGGCWGAALYLITLGPATRPGIALLLVAPPLLVVALAAWRGRAFWAGSGATRWWQRPVPRLALAALGILVGAAPALYFMLNFALVNGPILQVLLAPPVLSASLAIGFAWGRGDGRGSGGRGWWRAGTRAALLSALGYSLAIVGLIAFWVITWITLPRPIGHGLGGGALAFAIYIFSLIALSGSLGASFAFAALGGAVGAALRVAPPVE